MGPRPGEGVGRDVLRRLLEGAGAERRPRFAKSLVLISTVSSAASATRLRTGLTDLARVEDGASIGRDYAIRTMNLLLVAAALVLFAGALEAPGASIHAQGRGVRVGVPASAVLSERRARGERCARTCRRRGGDQCAGARRRAVAAHPWPAGGRVYRGEHLEQTNGPHPGSRARPGAAVDRLGARRIRRSAVARDAVSWASRCSCSWRRCGCGTTSTMGRSSRRRSRSNSRHAAARTWPR